MGNAETRKRILESALRLFSQKGYLGATTREIAEEAGVAELTVFRHFSTKENLFEQALQDYSFLPVLERIIEDVKDRPYEEGLLIIARGFYDALCKKKDIIKIIQSEIQRYPEKIHLAYHSMIDGILNALAGYFKELQRQGILRRLDTLHTARAFTGMVFSLFNMQELLLRGKYRHEDEELILKTFINIFIRGTVKQ